MQAFIYIEPTEEKVDPIVQQIAARARKMGLSPLRGIAVGNHLEGKVAQLSGFLDEVLIVESRPGKEYNTEVVSNVLVDVMASSEPSLLFFGFTHQGMELAPAVAYRLGFPLASACVDYRYADNVATVTRLIHGSKVALSLELAVERGVVLSIQKGALKEEETDGIAVPAQPPVLKKAPWKDDYEEKKTRLLHIIGEAGDQGEDITKARILVSVGRGFGGQDNLDPPKELAARLGGMLSCSRPVVDMGWLPGHHQVGISGKSVSPTVYLALAISGQANHIVAMETSKIIIAVNKDPQAPIFQVAHYGVVDDVHQFVPQMIEELSRKEG